MSHVVVEIDDHLTIDRILLLSRRMHGKRQRSFSTSPMAPEISDSLICRHRLVVLCWIKTVKSATLGGWQENTSTPFGPQPYFVPFLWLRVVTNAWDPLTQTLGYVVPERSYRFLQHAIDECMLGGNDTLCRTPR